MILLVYNLRVILQIERGSTVTTIKIGYNPATNMLPFFHFLDTSDNIFELVEGFPAQHNLWLAEGKIDIAPISSFSFGEHWTKYVALPDLSVSALGKVGSISLFSHHNLEQLDGKKIALTNTSATSVNLLKIVLEYFIGVKPDYQYMEPYPEKMLREADAGLLIGDEAIRAGFELDCAKFDLGEVWYQFTGYSMTYALWAVPTRFVEQKKDLVNLTHRRLVTSKEKGTVNLARIIGYCLETVGYTREFWGNYFSSLSYQLTGEEMEGLNHYYRLCHKMGLLASIPKINLLDD